MRTALMLVLMVLAAAKLNAAPKGLPAFTVPDCLGVNIHFVGPEQKQVEQLSAAGFRFIRMDYIWSHVEAKKGEYNFEPYDQLLDALDKQGIRALFILCYGNPGYDGGAAPHTDEARDAFVKYASTAAARYRNRGVLWEIWNEPNLTQFWKPQASAEDYIKLAKALYPALKKADPECTVLAPALAGWDFGWLETIFKMGLLEYTDVVSLHAYGAPKPEDAARYYATVRSLVSRYAPAGRQMPIVSGEWGYTAVGGTTVEMQGQYIARMFLTNMMNDVRLSIWYDWHDDGTDPKEGEHHFGTVYPDFSEKPAYVAARTLMRELNGYAFAARVSGESDDDYLALFRKGDDYRLAAWTTADVHTTRIPLDVPKVKMVSLTGESREAEVKSGLLEVELSRSVQYIEPLSKSKRWALEAGWKVTASTLEKDGSLLAHVASEMAGEHPGAEMKVTGDGVTAASARATSGSKAGRISCDTKYVAGGKPRPVVRVTLAVGGMQQPLVRVVEMDTSAVPTLDVLPPAGNDLMFEVRRPAISRAVIKGNLLVGNSDGLRLESESAPFEIAEGAEKATVRLKMSQAPAGVYSFACKITSEAGADLVRIPAKRYSLVETFADGKAGEEVRKYQLELDGDSKVPAMVKLTYAPSPVGGPNEVCARLDYNFDTGWRFVRVSPRPMIRIPEAAKSVKMWIRGDNRDGQARLRVTDSDGQTFQQDYGRMNYADWRCLEARLTQDGAGHWGGTDDGRMRYPISWDTLFLLDNAGGRQQKGTVFLGPAMVSYD